MAAVAPFGAAQPAASTIMADAYAPRPNSNPAREIAHEFIASDNSWKTLPQRLERLCKRLQAWVRACWF